MSDTREYSEFQFETSTSLENMTTEMTTLFNMTTTIPVPSEDGLSDGVIAGIVIGAVSGVIALVFLVLIVYKYRQRLLEIIHKDSKQSNNRSVPDKGNTSRPNITYSPAHEYLTINPFTSPK